MCEDWTSLEFLNVHSPAYLPNDFGKKKKSDIPYKSLFAKVISPNK